MDELGQRQREFAALTDNMSEGFLLVDYRTNILACNHSAFQLLTEGKEGEVKNLRRDGCMPEILTTVEAALAGVRTDTVQEIARRLLADHRQSGGVQRAGGRCGGAGHGRDGAGAAGTAAPGVFGQRLPRAQDSAHLDFRLCRADERGYGAGTDKVKEFAGDIYQESQRLIALVDDIIRLSKLDENSKPFEQEEVDLYDLSDEILANLRPVADRQQVSLHLSGTHIRITGVWQILNEMVYNLCDNAIKYNRPGGRVDVSVYRGGGRARLQVSDTGIGIPYADQSRVFERFYRVDKSHSKEVGGTGLGLSIVKHGAQYHNAQLELKSEPDKGSTITILF